MSIEAAVRESSMSINLRNTEDIPVNPVMNMKSFILPMIEILGRVSPEVAELYRIRAPHTGLHQSSLAMAEKVSIATNLALHAWAAVMIHSALGMADEEYMYAANRKNCFETKHNDAIEIKDLAQKIFIALTPYVRAFSSEENKLIDSIRWAESLINDMLVEVTYIRLW